MAPFSLESTPSALELLLAAAVAWIVVRSFKSQNWGPHPLPPGPPRDPVLGGVRHFPPSHQWVKFSEWRKKYGNIVYTHVFGSHIVILNSFDDAKEILDNRGAIHSSRPRLVMARELLGWTNTLSFMPYGERFQRHRNWSTKYFNPRISMEHRPHQLRGVSILLNDLLKTPDEFLRNVERLAASSLLMITYGIEAKRDNDPYVKAVKDGLKAFLEAGNHGAMLVDLFPMLRHIPSWLPGAGWKKRALEGRKRVHAMMEMAIRAVEDKRARGAANPCIALELIEEYEQSGLYDPELEDDIRGFAGTMYPAGVETITSTINVFIFAIMLNPEVARKAQKETDRVVGNDRFPDFSDRESLPYIDCIVKETYRWNPVLPLGVPHLSIEDDIYGGYHIPKGSTIIPNIWLMMHDEEFYSNPDQFIPERFLEEPGKGQPYDTSSYVFGFGRRICPGKAFADATVWLIIANILSVLDIKPALDGDGNEIIPKLEFSSGITSVPLPYKCRFIPRSEQARSLIVKHNPIGS